MRIIRSIPEMQEWSSDEKSAGNSIGFVPTMGALHQGHAELITRSVSENKRTVVSIFVNSLQFDSKTDLEAYPRQLEQDQVIAKQQGVDVLFVPDHDEMYPKGFASLITAGPIAQHMEGLHRPGHFDGVATVVVKLLNAAMPDVSYFGLKDFQQLAVIRGVVRDLNIKCEIKGIPTVRSSSGLALSSRNSRLSPERLEQASCISTLLAEMAHRARTRETSTITLANHFNNGMKSISAAKVEYVEVVDSHTLLPVTTAQDGTTICVAVWFDDVRLIDNISI
jgi:pantoate--beta-alanine ligase